MNTHTSASEGRAPWNKGKLVGQKAPLRISEIWAIRVRLEIYERRRDLGLFHFCVVLGWQLPPIILFLFLRLPQVR